MGIYDREYYREGPSLFAQWAGQGKVVLWLLGITIACFFVQILTQDRGSSVFTEALVLDINKLFAGQLWRVLTYAFVHAHDNVFHIAWNMLFLWWFGRQVEEELGSREFLLFYLLAAVVAGLAFVGAELLLIHPFWQLGWRNASVLGASGAVAASLVFAACCSPRQVIYLMLVIPVPLWLAVVLFVAKDAFGLLSQMSGTAGGGVAVAAPLGGMTFGFLYYRFGWRLAGLTQWMRLAGRSRPRLRVYREDDDFVPIPHSPPLTRTDDEHLEAQVDDILAKVSRVGLEGLSEHERQVLLKASEAMRRRRG